MSEEMVAAGGARRSWPDSTLMSRLDESAGEELVSLVPGIRYRAGTVLINQGARDMRVYLLEPASSGTARASRSPRAWRTARKPCSVSG